MNESTFGPEPMGKEEAFEEAIRMGRLREQGEAQSYDEAAQIAHTEIEHEKLYTPYSSPQERVLLERGVEKSVGLLGGQIGNARAVKLEDDGSGVFKPHDRWPDDSRTEFIHRERAAYLIDRFLGFSFVPPTVIRNIEGEVGSFQEFVTDAKPKALVDEKRIDENDLKKMNVFDLIIGNTDRNDGNWLIHNKTGKIAAIDHGYSLSEEAFRSIDRRRVRDIPSIPESVMNKVREFASRDDLKQILRELLAELLDAPVTNQFFLRLSAFISAVDAEGNFSSSRYKSTLGIAEDIAA